MSVRSSIVSIGTSPTPIALAGRGYRLRPAAEDPGAPFPVILEVQLARGGSAVQLVWPNEWTALSEVATVAAARVAAGSGTYQLDTGDARDDAILPVRPDDAGAPRETLVELGRLQGGVAYAGSILSVRCTPTPGARFSAMMVVSLATNAVGINFESYLRVASGSPLAPLLPAGTFAPDGTFTLRQAQQMPNMANGIAGVRVMVGVGVVPTNVGANGSPALSESLTPEWYRLAAYISASNPITPNGDIIVLHREGFW